MISKDWKMKNDDKDIRQQPIQQLAMIWNYNAHVEHQHNYYGGKPERAREVFVPVDLQFFDPVLFGTEEGQKGLTALVKEAAGLIDVNSGSSWFGLYAAYRYYKKQLGTKREYVKFYGHRGSDTGIAEAYRHQSARRQTLSQLYADAESGSQFVVYG